MKSRFVLGVVITCHLLVFGVFAQESYWSVKRFAAEDGLLDANVLSVQQHTNGVIYCNTAKGLFYNDGSGFKQLPIKNLSYRSLTAFYICSNGTLYLSIYNKGLYQYNWSQKTMQPVAAISGNNANQILTSSNWALLFTRGIRVTAVNLKTGTVIQDPQLAYEKNNLAYASLSFNDSIIFIGRKSGIYKFQEGRFQLWKSTPSPVTALAIFQNQLCYKTAQGINRYNFISAQNTLEPVDFDATDILTLSTDAGSEFLIPESKGNYWLVNESASELWHTAKGRFKPYLNRLGIPQGIVNGLYKDYTGNVWICMAGQGLYVIWGSAFKSVIYEKSDPELRYLNVETYQQHWLIGTNNGFLITNADATNWYRVGHEDAYFKKPISSIAVKNQNIVLSSVYGARETEYKSLRFNNKNFSYCFEHSEKSITNGSTQFIAAAFGCVLKVHDNKTDTILNIPGFETRIHDLIWYNNALFIATSHGLYIWNTHLPKAQLQTGSFAQKAFFNFCIVQQHLWIAHENGISNWNIQKDIAFKPKPIDIAVTKIRNNASHIYIASQNGIFICTPDAKIINHVTQAQGLPSDYVYDINLMSSTIMAVLPGAIALADVSDLIKQQTAHPDLSIQYHNTGQSDWQPLIAGCIMDATQSRITWHWLKPEFHPRQHLKFRWRMDGGAYNYTSESQSECLIGAGAHTIEASYSLSTGDWSAPLVQTFYRNPTFTERKAFKIGLWIFIVGALIALILLVIYVQGKQSKKQLHEAQALNRLKHQAMNALLSPHFIFNSLTSIQHYINENNKLKASEYLAKFSRLIRMIIERASHSEIALHDEINRLRMYLELEKERFNDKFTYTIELDAALDINTCTIPNMIIQPHVENALLHGILPKSGSGHIDIQFLKTERHVWIRISDNGVGAQSLKQHKTHNSLATETINQILTLNTKINGKLQRVTRRFLKVFQNEGTQIEILLEL